MRPLLLLIAATLLLSSCHNNQPVANFDIVPKPKEATLSSDKTFTLDQNTLIYYDDGLQREAEFLRQYTNDILCIGLKTHPFQGQRDGIVLRTRPDGFDNAEAYEISVTPKQVTITGADAAGVFYAIQTLRKSLPTDGNSHKTALPSCIIHDWPDFGYRGMHIDPCRHFIPFDSVTVFIDMMAMHNMNQLHLHLSDDQGWRIEIKKYPELTKTGAFRNGTVIGHNSKLHDTIRHGGFYTQDELRRLITYAAERHINIIPEIDLPGHTQAALACYPQMGCSGGPYEVWQRWGVSDEVLCAGNEEAMRFAEDVLNEVMDVFASPYIHIGGDECPKTRWKKCPKCQAKIKELGLKSDDSFSAEDYLQSYVMNRMAKTVEARGRRVIGWDEILDGDVSESAIIMSWRGTENGIKAAQKGHDVIMVPASHLYFDYYQSDDIANEPLAIGGYIPVERVLEFQPLPKELTEEEKNRVIGLQANIWTEYIASFRHLQYMALPRMAALAETQWNNPEQRDFEDFTCRCKKITQLYDLYHYDYAKHIFSPRSDDDTTAPNLLTNKPIALRKQPNEKYAYKGAATLNDGILGRGRHDSGRWLGFWGDPIDAVIDLGEPTEAHSIRFRALVAKGSWIYNPSSVTVLASTDGEHYSEVAHNDFAISTWDDSDGIFTYSIDFKPITMTHVEINITGHDLPNDHDGYGNPAWIFVDEIEMF